MSEKCSTHHIKRLREELSPKTPKKAKDPLSLCMYTLARVLKHCTKPGEGNPIADMLRSESEE